MQLQSSFFLITTIIWYMIISIFEKNNFVGNSKITSIILLENNVGPSK